VQQAISALSVQNNAFATASQILGTITGICAAAKGITLERDGESNYLYRRAEDLTVEVLNRAFGNISKEAVFQPFSDQKMWLNLCYMQGNAFDKFAMTIWVKQADIRNAHDVRMFFLP